MVHGYVETTELIQQVAANHDIGFSITDHIHLPNVVLCTFHPEFEELSFRIRCSNDCAELITIVRQKAKEMNCKYISTLCVGDDIAVQWYTTRGFVIVSEKPFHDSNKKTYSMIMKVI
jgi:hypothetical protein